MERLTSNKDVPEMDMVELAHNSCYAKDGKAWYREYGRETDARELARKLMIYFTDEDIAYDSSDEDFDEYMADRAALVWDCVGDLVALFYRNMWAMADLHARLKYLEDLQEHGRLLELPCAVGDMLYIPNKDMHQVEEYLVEKIEIDSEGFWVIISSGWVYDATEDFEKKYFLIREEAEEALKRMVDGNE